MLSKPYGDGRLSKPGNNKSEFINDVQEQAIAIRVRRI
jgi:hypothetical protein